MVRVVLGKGPRAHVCYEKLQKLTQLDVESRVTQIKRNNMHKIAYVKSPQYLIEKIYNLLRTQVNTAQETQI